MLRNVGLSYNRGNFFQSGPWPKVAKFCLKYMRSLARSSNSNLFMATIAYDNIPTVFSEIIQLMQKLRLF